MLIFNSRSLNGLIIYPKGSVNFALSRISPSEYAVRYTTGMLNLERISLAVSIPSISPCNTISIKTRSGRSSSTFLRASFPEEAVDRTMYPRLCIVLLMSSATRASSSTTSICDSSVISLPDFYLEFGSFIWIQINND